MNLHHFRNAMKPLLDMVYSFSRVFMQELSSSSEFYYSSKKRQGLRKDLPWRPRMAWPGGRWRCPRQAERSVSWREFPWESVFFAKPKNMMTRRKMPKNHTNIGSRSTKKSTDCCKSAVCFDLANTMYSEKY